MLVLPICMKSSHSRFQVSSLIDFTRVTDGPNARCAPEQFKHTKTPKAREAPKSQHIYSTETCFHTQRKTHFIFV